jgi:hypothetical protein
MVVKVGARILLASIFAAGLIWGIYTRTPPSGTNLTGIWVTRPDFCGTVVALKHSRFRLVGKGYWFTDCGYDSHLTACGRVAGGRLVLKLLPLGRDAAEWGVAETNTYEIIVSDDSSVWLKNFGDVGRSLYRQKPDER